MTIATSALFLTPGAKECLWIGRNLHHCVFSVTALVITDIREMHNNTITESFSLEVTSGGF